MKEHRDLGILKTVGMSKSFPTEGWTTATEKSNRCGDLKIRLRKAKPNTEIVTTM